MREPEPGTGLSAGFQRSQRKGWRGEGERNGEKTTPELPDQVIAVRYQSAAEGEVGKREEGHAPGQSSTGQRERQSRVKPLPIGSWLGWDTWATLTSPLQPLSQPLSEGRGARGGRAAAR